MEKLEVSVYDELEENEIKVHIVKRINGYNVGLTTVIDENENPEEVIKKMLDAIKEYETNLQMHIKQFMEEIDKKDF